VSKPQGNLKSKSLPEVPGWKLRENSMKDGGRKSLKNSQQLP
jgi:hypothetical protein